ncbi:5-formyltetrahydrofolate cyclo-ligase [Bacillus sp. DNRA2]|uniref:5-formyltetrahydrofolate cyclo-ligase n=1 Tax=Bacillus sp. DNRA2 TaxID=2723053 RepID=UPI00145E2E34|nr:5-formyltetrahydrofolate cyclo-ligase [Bacillus sp. DNRA2]NMD71849.1 5-formyltetrahydrofolate cyclo-ligase [Bacillus sp. DNRA2]
MDKKQLRKQMKDILSSITKPQYEDQSYRIAQTLFQDSDWLNANTIGLTISNPPEVDTYQIIRKAWEQNKIVVAAKCNPADKSLQFRKLETFSQLESIFFGLYEPIEVMTSEIPIGKIDLLLVPGLSLNKQGYRLGFGGGYYDRFLRNYHGSTISLAFDVQMVEDIPVEGHDLPVAKIITNHEVIRTNG